jgi:DNA repair exonuclease SbcCD nuclease subunit
VFCADLQAREQVYKHNRELKGDDLVALEQVVAYCNQLDAQCEALILGGDQVDSPRIGDDHVISLRQILRSCNAPVYYIDGNHERGFRRLELEGGEASVALNLEDHPFQFDPTGRNLSVNGHNWRSRRAWEQVVEEGIKPCTIRILHGFADQAIEGLGLSTSAVDLGDYDLDWFDGRNSLCLMGDIHQPMHFVGPEHLTDYYYPGSMWMHRANEPVDKQFLVIDTELNVTAVPLETRPFFKADIRTSEETAQLLKDVLAVTPPKDIRIQKPRVHIDVYGNDNFEKELSILRQHAHLFVRIRPSRTTLQLDDKSMSAKTIDLKEAIAIVGKDDLDTQRLLTDIFDSGVDAATEKLRKKLGVE